MAYVTREDGERFIVPSYRDILSAKKKSLLKREILLLSANYGEYVYIREKNVSQYEVVFSTEPGYLLGETIWNYFKSPVDMIYCEALPNSTEVLLVIVKNGSVYLDGSFPRDSVAEELVVFVTQVNNFEIFVYGDVPLSQFPADGKFAFEPALVKSFTELSDPVFPTLTPVKALQLKIVTEVLRAKGIGVLPIKPIILGVGAIFLAWLLWQFLSQPKQEVISHAITSTVNPFENYVTSLSTPSPVAQVQELADQVAMLMGLPGWRVTDILYKDDGSSTAAVVSDGSRTYVLKDWAERHQVKLDVKPNGIALLFPPHFFNNRPAPNGISHLQDVVTNFVDRLSYIMPGNTLTIGASINHGKYTHTLLTINLTDANVNTLKLLSKQLQDLPLVFLNAKLTIDHGVISGTILVNALGN